MVRLSEYVKEHKNDKMIPIFFDVETFQFNEEEGRKKPTNYKNMVYSFAVSYFTKNGTLETEIFPNFKAFTDELFKEVRNKFTKKPSLKAKIVLNAHNTNKYDNHYIRKEISYYYPNVVFKNAYLKNATNHKNSTKMKEITTEMKQALILEKRVKSSINLEMTFFIEGVKFETQDNFMKTHTSIAILGKKLLRANLIKKEELKTDFNYTEFNLDEDMTDDEAKQYALDIFNNRLTEKHFTYIRNDVIILGKAVYHYSTIFPDFDYSKITFTANILEKYNQDNKASYQLLNSVRDESNKEHKINYTEYQFSNENLYDYFKKFYYGGLNFYNPNYVNQLIEEKCFSIDINSSYPFVMHNEKMPYMIHHWNEKQSTIKVDLENDNYFYLFRLSVKEANKLLNSIESITIRKMFVKYYNDKNGYISINSNALRLIEKFTGFKIEEVTSLSYVCFRCDYFSSRKMIEHFYFIKSQGKEERKLIMNSPYDYYFLDEKNTQQLSSEEIDLAKVYLNGLYGIPALRAYFNLFRINEETGFLENELNGFKNSQRNIVFSAYVTSKAFYNLLLPLTHLEPHEIDDNFLYADTDSIYLKEKVKHKIPTTIYDPISLGKWGYDCEHIEAIYILNHKKYCYWNDKPKKDKPNIVLKCGGIPLDSFNYDYDSLQEFVDNEFHHGKIVKNQSSIYTKYETIAIYESETKIEKGHDYFSVYSERHYEDLQELIEMIRENEKFTDEDTFYYETNLGTLTVSDVFPMIHETKNLKTIKECQNKQYVFIKKYIEGVL